MSFRTPKYVEKYEYVSFNPDTAVPAPPNDQPQKVNGYRFNVDNTTDPHPYDWYNAFIAVKFKVEDLDGTAVAAAAREATVNSIYSFFDGLMAFLLIRAQTLISACGLKIF